MDERSIYHRYRATRWSVSAGLIVIAGWFFYDYIFRDVIRWDFFIIMCVMAAVKVIARLIYMKTN